jgi:sigma-B regulation protein RsbU (phosphoserine phosphatase)
MLPPPEARLPQAGVSISIRCRPCAHVAGDLADYAQVDGNRAAMVVADVAGHGISAAMLTTLVKSAFSSTPQGDPLALVQNIAVALRPFQCERFVTMLAARIDRAAQTLEYVNAGHPAGFVFSAAKVVQTLDATGPLILPISSPQDFELKTVPLPSNSGILLYTDGISSALGESAQLSTIRAEEFLQQYRGGAALLDGILAAVNATAANADPPDDLTLLTASIGVPGLVM